MVKFIKWFHDVIVCPIDFSLANWLENHHAYDDEDDE